MNRLSVDYKPTPLCHTCNKPVDYAESWYNAAVCCWYVQVECHGEVERRQLSAALVVAAAPLVLDFATQEDFFLPRVTMRMLAHAVVWYGPYPGWSNASPYETFSVVVIEDDDPGDEDCVPACDRARHRLPEVSPGARRNLIAAGVLRF